MRVRATGRVGIRVGVRVRVRVGVGVRVRVRGSCVPSPPRSAASGEVRWSTAVLK